MIDLHELEGMPIAYNPTTKQRGPAVLAYGCCYPGLEHPLDASDVHDLHVPPIVHMPEGVEVVRHHTKPALCALRIVAPGFGDISQPDNQ